MFIVGQQVWAVTLGALVGEVGPVRVLLPADAHRVLCKAPPSVVLLACAYPGAVVCDSALLARHAFLVLGDPPAPVACWLEGLPQLRMPIAIDALVEAVEAATWRVTRK